MFVVGAVDQLWSLARHTDPRVSGAAYRALAAFPSVVHTVAHLASEVNIYSLVI